MDAFDFLIKAAVPPPAKGKKKNGKDDDAKNGGGDCPTDDSDGDGIPNSLDAKPDSAGGESDKKGPPGANGEEGGDDPFGGGGEDGNGNGELTPEEQAAMDEGGEFPPEEGMPGEGMPEEGMPGEEGMDEAAAAQGEMSELISQLAEAEQKFYATKGQHGGGHHQTDVAMEEMHKLVRKLAKKVASAHGLEKDGSIPEPQPGMEMEMEGGNGPPEEMARSLSPNMHAHVLRQALELQKSYWPDPQMQTVSLTLVGKQGQHRTGDIAIDMMNRSREPVKEHTAPKPHKENVGVAVPQHAQMSGSTHLPGPATGAPMSAAMAHPAPGEISMSNYVGDPNGGTFLNWGGIMVGRMGTAPASAGGDGHPSEIIERDGRRTVTGHGSIPGASAVPGPPFSAKMDADQATAVVMPGATAPMSPPAAKMGGGDWIDWNAYDGGERTMPFASEMRGLMGDRAEMHGKATLLAHQGPISSSSHTRGGSTTYKHHATGRTQTFRGAPLTGRGVTRTSPSTTIVRPRQRTQSVANMPPGRMTGHQQGGYTSRRGVQLTPGRTDSGPVRGISRAVGPEGMKRVHGGGVGKRGVSLAVGPEGQKRVHGGGVGKVLHARMTMDPQPSVPGMPLHESAAMNAPMAEYETPGMTGFDYAMIGRMQRMDAGYTAIETMERSEPPRTLVSGDVSFEFLLDMGKDFLAKSDDVNAWLED